jgi:ribosomal protein L21E
MVQRVGGARRKTRHKMSKSIRKKGKISLTQMFAKFNVGDKVLLQAEPGVQTGMFHRRFYGKIGVVKGAQGKCYKVEAKDSKKPKIFLVHPVHLRRM